MEISELQKTLNW